MKKLLISAFAVVAMINYASADTISTNFESATAGSVNGYENWSITGTYDQAVVDVDALSPFAATFGTKALRISNGIASGSFGDQLFAGPLADGVGEASSTAATFATGTLQNHFEMEFDFASVSTSTQTGLNITISPDRGDGSRMSYIKLEDTPTGIDVIFFDVQGKTSPSFVSKTVATGLSRETTHKVKMTMDIAEGPSNDLVRVYVDGTEVHVGTSWEDYFRYSAEASAEQSPRVIKTLGFFVRGSSVSANLGAGFLLDNFAITSSSVSIPTAYIVTPASNTFGQVVTVNSTTYYSGINTYTSIQSALDAAPAGETVYVTSGTYTENATISKAVTLVGSNTGVAGNATRGSESILDANGAGAALRIMADNVTVDGFKVINGGGAYSTGIWMADTSTTTIKNSVLTSNESGIWADCANNCVIENNLFDGNNDNASAAVSGGISADGTNGLVIRNNEFKNEQNGNPILLQATGLNAHNNLTVSGNNFHSNTNSNVYALSITNGTFTNNTVTPAVDSTGFSFSGGNTNVTITDNTISNGARGIRIEDPGYGFGGNSNFTIRENIFLNDSEYAIGVTTGGYTGTIDAHLNYYGLTGPTNTLNPNGIASPVVGTEVDFSPWYAAADESRIGFYTGSTPLYTATSTESFTKSGAGATLEFSSGTVLTGTAAWNGEFAFPQTTSIYTIVPGAGFQATDVYAIELGASTTVTTSKAIKVTIANKAGSRVGLSTGSNFAKITAICNNATNPTLAAGASCTIDQGTDLVVFTKSPTTFVIYTELIGGGTSGGSSGGGSSSSSGSTSTSTTGTNIATTTTVTTQTNTTQTSTQSTANTNTQSQGQVLGATTYSFTSNAGFGARGNDVSELQKVLIAQKFLNISAPTGYFGPLTRAALARWQAKNNLPSTGFFGPLSRAAILNQ